MIISEISDIVKRVKAFLHNFFDFFRVQRDQGSSSGGDQGGRGRSSASFSASGRHILRLRVQRDQQQRPGTRRRGWRADSDRSGGNGLFSGFIFAGGFTRGGRRRPAAAKTGRKAGVSDSLPASSLQQRGISSACSLPSASASRAIRTAAAAAIREAAGVLFSALLYR